MRSSNTIISVIVASTILFSGCSSKSLFANNEGAKAAAENSIKTSEEAKNNKLPKGEAKVSGNQKQDNQNSNTNKSGNITSNQPVKVDKVVPQPSSKNKAQENINININNSEKQVQVSNNASSSAQDLKSNSTANYQNSNTGSSGEDISFNAQGMPSYNVAVGSYAEYYNEVYNSLKNFDDKVYIKINNYNSNTYNLDVINKVLQDYYDIDYGFSGADATLYYMGDTYILNINYKYNSSKATMIAMKNKVQSKAQTILSQIIKPNMTVVQKELAIHDYIVNNTVYDYDDYVRGTLPKEVYTDYGVFINGKAVCEGYAKAMQKLLRMEGIESKAVEGQASGIPHAWNLVKVNGVYTNVDATWDDPVTTTRQNILSHDYFNISDAKLAADHQWNRNEYPAGVAIK